MNPCGFRMPFPKASRRGSGISKKDVFLFFYCVPFQLPILKTIGSNSDFPNARPPLRPGCPH